MTSVPTPLGPDTVLRAVPGHWLAEVANETVVLHHATAQYFGLNEVGTRVWSLLADGASIEELSQGLAREYGLAPERIQGDLLPFLRELLATGLAEVVRE